MHMPWYLIENTLFATAISTDTGVRYYAVIEQLPEQDGWDWIVWRPGDTSFVARYGMAPHAVVAMATAQDITRYWDVVSKHASSGSSQWSWQNSPGSPRRD
jgi:hypothetical protein